MNPTSLRTLMEDVSFLLGRVSLLVPPPLLPLGGQRDALSGPVGSLYVPGMQKLLTKNGFALAQRRAMQDFGLFVSAAASRGKRGSCHPGVAQRGQQWLLPGWNSWKDAACPASAIPGGHKAAGAAHTGWHSSALSEGWAGPGITTGHGHTGTVPALGRGCRVQCPMAGSWRCCNVPAPVETLGVL